MNRPKTGDKQEGSSAESPVLSVFASIKSLDAIHHEPLSPDPSELLSGKAVCLLSNSTSLQAVDSIAQLPYFIKHAQWITSLLALLNLA